jgi:hypothetical protein
MPSAFIGPNAPPRPAQLEPPPEVRDAVSREVERIQQEQGLAVGAEAQKRMLDDWTIGYYFRDLDGVDIAYRPTDRGVEVLGLGLAEVLQVRQTYGDGEGADVFYREL